MKKKKRTMPDFPREEKHHMIYYNTETEEIAPGEVMSLGEAYQQFQNRGSSNLTRPWIPVPYEFKSNPERLKNVGKGTWFTTLLKKAGIIQVILLTLLPTLAVTQDIPEGVYRFPVKDPYTQPMLKNISFNGKADITMITVEEDGREAMLWNEVGEFYIQADTSSSWPIIMRVPEQNFFYNLSFQNQQYLMRYRLLGEQMSYMVEGDENVTLMVTITGIYILDAYPNLYIIKPLKPKQNE